MILDDFQTETFEELFFTTFEIFDDFSKDRLTFQVTSKQIVRRDLLRRIDRINYEEKEKIIFCNLFY